MRTTAKITITALFAALLLCGQFALSGIKGVEVVTALLLSFCCVYGAVMGIALATVFSVIRCLIFGFFPTVIILYLVYYNLFALFFGTVGKKLTEKPSLPKFVLVVVSAVVFTALFTLLDDIITPLFYGFSYKTAVTYFYASLATMVPQLVCTAVSVSVIYKPLVLFLTKYIGIRHN